jgi:hypothetical protein
LKSREGCDVNIRTHVFQSISSVVITTTTIIIIIIITITTTTITTTAGVKLTTHLHLVPRSRMRGAISPLPQYSMTWYSVIAQGKIIITITTTEAAAIANCKSTYCFVWV